MPVVVDSGSFAIYCTIHNLVSQSRTKYKYGAKMEICVSSLGRQGCRRRRCWLSGQTGSFLEVAGRLLVVQHFCPLEQVV